MADLGRSIAFYESVLGFELKQRLGNSAAFLAFGDYHHHLGLNTWTSRSGSPPPPGSTGLFHFAILYASRIEFAAALRRVLESGIGLDGAADHGVSEAVYLHDPDGNGIELYWDRPTEDWPIVDGSVAMRTDPLDVDSLLRLAPGT